MSELPAFFTLVRGFLTVFLPKVRCASPHTIKSYREAINLLLRYLNTEHQLTVANITFETLNRSTVTGFLAWLSERGAAPSTINQRLMALKSFLSYCAGEDPALVAIWLDTQHVRTARQPVRRLDCLSDTAVEALLNAPGQNTPHQIRDTFMLVLMFDTAARIQEVLDLTIADVITGPREQGVYLTGKGNKTRYVPITGTTVGHYQAHLKASFHGDTRPGDLVFFTTRNQQRHPMSQDNVAYLLHRYADQARVTCPDIPERVHAHQLRHARAKQLFRAGVPLAYIKEFLGHADISTTNIYASPDPDMLRDTLNQTSPPGQPETYPWEEDDMILRLAGLK